MYRFDHSPCDPTVTLKGCPSGLFACVACAQHFTAEEEWRKHLESKVDARLTVLCTMTLLRGHLF